MFNNIKEIENRYGLTFSDEAKLQQDLIVNIYNNNFEKHFDYDNFTLSKIGEYYQYVEQDYDQMKKYYLMAIEKGDGYSMYKLGYYYDEIEKDYDQMKKYYLMSIKKGNSDAMHNLGLYYDEIEENYKEMKKYYLSICFNISNTDYSKPKKVLPILLVAKIPHPEAICK